jgi:hypothetical protein
VLVNVIKFLEKISPIYFLYSVLLTILFSVIVNLAMYNRFDKIEIVRQKHTERRKNSLIAEAKKLGLQLVEPPKIA